MKRFYKCVRWIIMVVLLNVGLLPFCNGQGIGLWQLENAPDSNYIIKSIDGGEWYPMFIDSFFAKYGTGGGGGSGTVTSITAASPLTGGTITTTGTIDIQNATTSQDGALTSTDWNTFNNKLSSGSANGNYNHWAKSGNVITGSLKKYMNWVTTGSAARIPYFSNDSLLTSEQQYMINNSTNAYTMGIGFTGGNSTFGNYIDNNGASPGGIVIRDNDRPGIGFSTSSTDRWSISSNTTSDLMFKFSSADSWGSTPLMKINEGGAVYINDLANATPQMVVAGAGGELSTQAIPASSATNLTFSGTASPYDLNSSTGTGVKFASGSNMTITRSGNTLTFSSSGGGGSPVPSPWLDAGNINVVGNFNFATTANTYKYIDNNVYTGMQANTSNAIEPFDSNRKLRLLTAGYYYVTAQLSFQGPGGTTLNNYSLCIQSSVNDVTANYGCQGVATAFHSMTNDETGSMTVEAIIQVTSANETAGGLYLRLALFCGVGTTLSISRISMTASKIN